ncbi:CFI-box-CTERM domain-containing protein [Chloroflexota bacterium]
MMARTALALSVVAVLLLVPGTTLAADSSDDPIGQLTEDEANYVSSMRAKHASVRAQLIPLRSALMAPSQVTPQQWKSLCNGVYFTTRDLTASSPPPAFASIQSANHDIVIAANPLYNWGDVLEIAAGSAATLPDTSFIIMAQTLSDTNECVTGVEDALAVAEAGLEILAVIRAEELAEQEEQAETATGLSDLFGISLDPWDYCFIATPAYGTPAATEIDVLRESRDDALLSCGLGRAFVDFYYEHSPPVANFIADREWLRTAVREGFVDPIVWVIQETRPLWDPVEAP